MKTTNWQTRALTLFIAAVALWLTAACGNEAPTIEVQPTPETTATFTQATTEALTEEATGTPTRETTAVPIGGPTETSATVAPRPTSSPTPTTPEPTPEMTPTPTSEDATIDNQGRCTTETPELTSTLNTTEEEYMEFLYAHSRAGGVLHEHKELFWRQPNVYDVSTGFLRDENGEWTDEWGITVWVTEKVEQNTLPLEDRIPVTIKSVRPEGNFPIQLEGDVPIHIVEAEPPPKVAPSTCDYSMCRANSQKGETTMNTTNRNTRERRHEVRLKYDPLFWRQPNVFAVGEGIFTDEEGGLLKISGIVVHVTRKVDQSTLPPEDRIPDCLEGIPVQIIEDEPPVRQ